MQKSQKLENDPLCILICRNSIYILFIFSRWFRVISLNVDALIKGSLETFLHSHANNLKHLRIGNSRLLISKYYLQIFWHGINWKLTLRIPFDKWYLQRTSWMWSLDCLLKYFLVCNFKLRTNYKGEVWT